MDGREKFVFGECARNKLQTTQLKDRTSYRRTCILYCDLARAIAFNTKEKMLLIVENKGAVENFDPTAMVGNSLPCRKPWTRTFKSRSYTSIPKRFNGTTSYS